MYFKLFSKVFLLTVLLAVARTFPATSQQQEYYQIKTYSFDNAQQEQVTDDYLANAYLPALKRQGIDRIGVFKWRNDNGESVRKTMVLIPIANLETLATLDEKLAKDKKHQKAGKPYLEAPHDNAPYQRIESIVLKAFADMPILKPSPLQGDRKQRVYELRSYEAATERLHKNKVDMFNAGGEIKIFDKLEFNAVFYAEVISGPKMPNLMYMTTFRDQESRDAHWQAFRTSPDWLELKVKPEYQNNVSHSDKYFLYPTSYSDY